MSLRMGRGEVRQKDGFDGRERRERGVVYCEDVGVCGEEVSEYDDWQRRQPLPACQSIELGTTDDPAAAALDVQRCSVTPAVLPGWRADCAFTARLVGTFSLQCSGALLTDLLTETLTHNMYMW